MQRPENSVQINMFAGSDETLRILRPPRQSPSSPALPSPSRRPDILPKLERKESINLHPHQTTVEKDPITHSSGAVK